MGNIVKGMAAGLIAAIVLWITMYVRQAMALPGADPEQLMTLALYHLGFRIALMTGWVAHLLIGTVLWGGLFGFLNPALPGKSQMAKGLIFSLLTWLMMVVFVMPLALVGTAASADPGGITIAVTLSEHLLFGLILGAAYAAQPDTEPTRPAWIN